MKRAICIILTVTLFCGAFAYLCFADQEKPDAVVDFTIRDVELPDGTVKTMLCVKTEVLTKEKNDVAEIDISVDCNSDLFGVFPYWEYDNPVDWDSYYSEFGSLTKLRDGGFSVCVYENFEYYPDRYDRNEPNWFFNKNTCLEYFLIEGSGAFAVTDVCGAVWYRDGRSRPAAVRVRSGIGQVMPGAEPVSEAGQSVIDCAEEPQIITERMLYKLFDVDWGNSDSDDEITARDARTVLRASARLASISGWNFFRCDVDHDRKLTARDARRILRVSAKLESFT